MKQYFNLFDFTQSQLHSMIPESLSFNSWFPLVGLYAFIMGLVAILEVDLNGICGGQVIACWSAA
jgi:hypothetical protein